MIGLSRILSIRGLAGIRGLKMRCLVCSSRSLSVTSFTRFGSGLTGTSNVYPRRSVFL